MPPNSSTSGRSRQEVLPPLREVLPEMHSTRPDPEYQYSRTLDDSPIGPTSRTGASGLAPSPLASSNSRSRQQYANHLPHRSDSSVSSNYSERSGSYVTQGSSSRSSTTRSSPALPAVQSMALSDRTATDRPLEYREQRNLPPISTYNDGLRSSDPRYATSPQSARYPSQSYSTMQGSDYGSQYGRSSYGSSASGGSYPVNFDNLSDQGDGRQRRRRGNLPKQVTDILRGWFQDHIAHPYPTEDEKVGLMQMTGLTMSQISNWFINARRRSLPQITRQAQAEQELRENQSNLMPLSQGN